MLQAGNLQHSSSFHDPADFVFHDDRLVLLHDEPPCRDIDTGLELLVFLVARLEGQVCDCQRSSVCEDTFSRMASRHDLPKSVVFASGLPPRIAASSGVMSTTPV